MDDTNKPADDQLIVEEQTPAVEEAPAEETTVVEEETPTEPEAEAETLVEEIPEEGANTSEIAAEEVAESDSQEQAEAQATESTDDAQAVNDEVPDEVDENPNVKWYVVHTYSGHENKVATALKQRVEAEHLENKILDVLVPTQEKIEIRSGKKATVKEKIFPGYILVKMDLDDTSWLAVRTTQGVTSFVGIGNKPTPIPAAEVRSIVRFMSEGAAPTFKDVFMVDDTVKIVDGPFSEFIGKVDTVDKEKGKVRVLVSIFGRETPVELDFLQVQKL